MRVASRGGGDAQLVRIGRRDCHPCLIVGTAGQPVRVVFRREDSAPASEQIAFPGLGKVVTLRPFADVPVDLLAPSPGTYGFLDASGALRGALVVPESR